MKPKDIDFARAISLVNEGKAYSVFIDDTGTAGLNGQEITRFIAVVVKPEVSPIIPAFMQEAVEQLRAATGATEFHFKEIYNGNGIFKDVPLKTRLRILNSMTSAFSVLIRPTILVQSMEHRTLKKISQQLKLPNLPAPLSLTSPRNFAFIGILSRVFKHVLQTRSTQQEAVFFCDQGIFKAGVALNVPCQPGVIHKNLVFFVDSKRTRGIQLADFCAFVLNRQQLLAKRKKLSSLDKTFLLSTQPLLEFFQNVERRAIKTNFDPEWHMPYILKEELEGKEINAAVFDERTGVLLRTDIGKKNSQ